MSRGPKIDQPPHRGLPRLPGEHPRTHGGKTGEPHVGHGPETPKGTPKDSPKGWTPGGGGRPGRPNVSPGTPSRSPKVAIDPGAVLIPVKSEPADGKPEPVATPIDPGAVMTPAPTADEATPPEPLPTEPLAPPIAEPVVAQPPIPEAIAAHAAPPAEAAPAATTPELAEQFETATLPRAQPEQLANGSPRFKLEKSGLLVLRQAWQAVPSKDTPPAVAAQAKQLLSEAAQRKPAALGSPRSTPTEVKPRQLVLESPRGSEPRLKELVRFVVPTQPALPPIKAIVLLEVNGRTAGALDLSRGEEQLRASLPGGQLSGLSSEDLNRLWTDPAITTAAHPDQYVGKWEGRPLMSDITLPHPVSFTQHAWREGTQGVVGTFLIRPREQHAVMRLKAGAEAISAELAPAGLTQGMRGLKGKADLMLSRLSFALRDATGAPLPGAGKLYVDLMGDAARGAEKSVPDFMTRRERDGTVWLDFYYVAERKAAAADPTERDLFERAQFSAKRKAPLPKPKIQRRG